MHRAMSGGLTLQGANKKGKWGWSRYVCFGVIFFHPRLRERLTYLYLCLWFKFMAFLFMSTVHCSVPLGFMLISLIIIMGLAVWCDWLDSHSSISLCLVHTDTHSRTRCLATVCMFGGVMLNDVCLQTNQGLHCFPAEKHPGVDSSRLWGY